MVIDQDFGFAAGSGSAKILIKIRVNSLPATVVRLPFYDPEKKRPRS